MNKRIDVFLYHIKQNVGRQRVFKKMCRYVAEDYIRKFIWFLVPEFGMQDYPSVLAVNTVGVHEIVVD